MQSSGVLVLTYWSFKDPLIQTYTLPYVKIMRNIISGDRKIFLFTLEKMNLALDRQAQDTERNTLAAGGINWICQRYFSFGLRAAWMWIVQIFRLVRLIKQNNIDTIHCWCTPPAAIGYLLAKLTGKRLIIDSYEPHAEAMVENGTWSRNSVAFRILFYLERRQSHKAFAVVSATRGMHEYARIKYGVDLKYFLVKPACVNLNMFSYNNIKNSVLLSTLSLEDKIVCVYAGKFGGIYLDKEVFDFFKACHRYWGDRFRVLILSSHSKEEIELRCSQSDLDKKIVVLKFVSHQEIPDYIGLGDFAITPVKPVPTKRYCTPIKDGEYWALGLPVVIPRGISDDSEIIEESNAGVILNSFSQVAYDDAIVRLEVVIRKGRETNFRNIRPLAERFRNFKIAEEAYGKLYGNPR
jgi:hypothetical protein